MPVQINQIAAQVSVADHTDAFLSVTTGRAGKLKGEVEGPSAVAGDIRVQGWNWGVQASSAIGSGKATARRSYRNLIVTKRIDAASTKLLSALAINDIVTEAKLSLWKAGGQAIEFFTIKLENARVIDVDVTMGADGVPLETVVFAFAKIEVTYRPQQGTGSAAATSTFKDDILPV